MIPLWSMRWTILTAVAAGVFLGPAGQTWWRSVLMYYDASRPVVVMKGSVVKSEDDSVVLTIAGEKLRACTYIRLQAYTAGPDGTLRDAYARREDRPEHADNKPLGTFNLGTWRIWPKGDATRVAVYVEHDCDGRVVKSKIADVEV